VGFLLLIGHGRLPRGGLLAGSAAAASGLFARPQAEKDAVAIGAHSAFPLATPAGGWRADGFGEVTGASRSTPIGRVGKPGGCPDRPDYLWLQVPTIAVWSTLAARDHRR